ncbi:DUF2809 domain-containing protein [Bradyrhizobium tropiciagri]|uniref:ribosomal maturation YjgA family protein n=1 Tax=Bradyrhizobium tropiciagri TaxID=312253 RepID=UPI001BA68544|nr:DUF2809 domain-containing protein [Bradyrhizobium tropiciagri]MBR0870524.1 DUF2809 domain-containing protein [Bradyrhizobium tropiciagri]
MAKTHSTQRSSAAPSATGRALLCLAVIACGLALRRFGFPLGLPAFAVKYGGSLLWGTMVFFLVALLLPRRPRRQVALIALGIAILVELFRLVHTPWLDAFRLTTAGALLLGRIFSLWNMVAYAAGIVLAVAIDRLATSLRRDGRASVP